MLAFAIVGLFAWAALTPSAAATVHRIDNPQPAANAAFGTAIAGLGDQNGDGVADFAVGVPGSDRVDVFSGSDRSLIRSLHDPESLSGLQFGFALAAAGDVNGDGVEDLAVGAPGAPPGAVPLPCPPLPGPNECPPPAWGRVFVFSGANGALIRKIVPAVPDFFVFGFALASLPDVNGDGVRDLVVGAPVLLARAGAVYAFSGATGAELWLFREPPFPGKQPIASLGMFVTAIGDANGDGKADVLASAPFHDNAGDGSVLGGKVFVLSGGNGALVRSHEAATPIDNGFFGGTISAVGDQNGDGTLDYLIGHRGANAIQLHNGSDGALIRTLSTPVMLDSGLITFARAGDRDGDAIEDVWVGIPAASAAFLMNGDGDTLLTQNDPGAVPAAPLQRFGSALARIDDVNGDGKAEVLIGKPGETIAGLAIAGAAFLVTSNRPPVANAGADRTVAAGASCLGPITLDGSGSSDPDGDPLSYTWTGPFGTATGAMPSVSLPLGQHTITLVVDDANGGSDTDTVVITVADQSPPVIATLAATPSVLWPPNHRMRNVAVSAAATDNCDAAPVCSITAVVSNEPENGTGDGDTSPDSRVLSDSTLELRAERGGGGTGRIYSIVVTCRDAAGNSASATTAVVVPNNAKP